MSDLINPTGTYSVMNNDSQISNSFAAENSMLAEMGFTPEIMLKTAALMPPLLIADKFVNSTIGGKEENSVLKKIANLGDKIYRSMGKTGGKIGDIINNNRFVKYFTDDYSAIPRSSLAKGVVMPEVHLATELLTKISELKDRPEYSKYFEDGVDSLSKETRNYLKTVDPKNEKTMNEALKQTDKILKAADELIQKGVVKIENTGIIPGSSDLSVMRNKLKAADLKMGETALGSAFAKGANEAKNHLTFGGGLFGFAFVSFSLNHAFKEATEAPDGEKLSTFMHIISEEFIGFLILQASISPFYKVCGNKYRGMTKEARKELENIIQKANSNEKITKDEIKVAKLQRDLLLKGCNKDEVLKLGNKTFKEAEKIAQGLKGNLDIKFWERPLKWAGRLLSMGLDEIQKPKYWKLPIFGKVKRPQPTFKGTIGGLGRLALILGVVAPFFQKPVTYACSKIFGEPKAYLEKEKAKENPNNNEQNSAEQNPVQNNNNETNLVKKWTNLPQNAQYTQNEQKLKKTPTNLLAAHLNTPERPTIKPNAIIPAANLAADKSSEKKLYVPSINVDYSYLLDEEKELNQKVSSILKHTDGTINRISESLRN